MYKVLYTSQNKMHRILEVENHFFNLEDLEGDSFDSKVNPSLDAQFLKFEQNAFRRDVLYKGVYGYVLEKWNPEPDQGWQHLDSCWGFVGQYNENSNRHYIVKELKGQINE